MLLWAALVLCLGVALILIPTDSGPVVTLSYGAFQGLSTGVIDTFFGVPYAEAPVGILRLRKPQPVSALTGVQSATTFGHSCLQLSYALPHVTNLDYTPLEGFVPKATAGEDCLNLNVFRPSNIARNTKLPVVVFFYGGAFMTGDASSYNASAMISRSISLGTPIIYAAVNYRVNAFGFLGGQQVLDAGVANLGMYDQIMALEWIQKQISAFGGDPRKVTIWGESAGSVSAITHMILNANSPNPPFRAVILESSYTQRLESVASAKRQNYYNILVQQTNCSSASSQLECLRQVPTQTIVDIVNTTPGQLSTHGLNMSWGLAVDGVLLNKTLKQYIRDGHYAKIPVIAGQNDDEGTLFSISNAKLTSQEFLTFIQTEYFPDASVEALDNLISHFPEDPAMGSPFGTGDQNVMTPGFKRLSAFHGDFGFESGRREALDHFISTQKVWSFLWKRHKTQQYLGSAHGTELPEMYANAPIDFVATDALINFINYLDPNYPQGSTAKSNLSSIIWPAYNTAKQMLVFSDNATEAYTTVVDDYRAGGIQACIEMLKEFGM